MQGQGSALHVTGFVLERNGKLYASMKSGDRQARRLIGRVYRGRSVLNQPQGSVTRGQAEARLEVLKAEFAAELSSAPAPERSVVTLAAAVNAWLTHCEHSGARHSTLYDYGRAMDHQILPRLGSGTDVASVTAQRILQLRDELFAAGLAPATVQKLLVLTSGVFKLAVEREWIGSNPVRGKTGVSGRVRERELQFYEPDEVVLLCSRLSDDMAALVTVAAFTGLRRGELLALRWRDVDFAGRIVHVRRSRVRGRVDAPKSGKARSVPMADQALIAFDYLSRRARYVGPGDLVFSDAFGEPVKNDVLRSRFREGVLAAGLPMLRFHDLRHTFGTLCAGAGLPLHELQAWMGHANIKTTMIYVHYAPQHVNAQRLTEAFRSRDRLEVAA